MRRAFFVIYHNFMNQHLLFTINFGAKDIPQPARVTSGWDYLAITDGKVEYEYPWRVEKVDTTGKEIKRLSRKYKILGQEYFASYQTVVYCDASYQPYGNLNEFIAGKKEGVWMGVHPQRDCTYREGEAIRNKQLDNPELVLRQVARYRDEGLLDRSGLWRCGVFIRNRGSEEFFEKWYEEVLYGSWRDQLSCTYSAWKTGTTINALPHGEKEKYFRPHLHATYPLDGGIVHLTDPAQIPNQQNNQWICIGNFPEAEQAIARFPLVHLIFNKEGALLFPRWLYSYLWDLDKMVDYVSAYGGQIGYWGTRAELLLE